MARLLVLTLAMACGVALGSEVVQLESEQAVLEKKGKAPPAPAKESSVRDGNQLQDVYERPEIKAAAEGSLAGDADPGFGLASASRTEMQRAHEEDVEKRAKIQAQAAKQRKPVPVDDPLEPVDRKEARNLERSMYRAINRQAGGASAADRERARSTENIASIKSKARKMRAKMQDAINDVQHTIANEEKDAAAASQQSEKVSTGKQSKAKQEKEAIEAEEKKLKTADHTALGKFKPGSLFDEKEPIATYKSGNWADRTRYPNLRHYRPKGRNRDNAAYRNKGDTPEAQRKP